ncbi:hypothetical protein CRG98_028205 [Punica granatum]|uniref:Uncharacterized protein n=1 Tax=Punica granatum TaxID=22663 RepID=A0A2I0J5C0_PUNGR|nr:hypothetical protein CRG98_028205 [Punica granatum]
MEAIAGEAALAVSFHHPSIHRLLHLHQTVHSTATPEQSRRLLLLLSIISSPSFTSILSSPVPIPQRFHVRDHPLLLLPLSPAPIRAQFRPRFGRLQPRFYLDFTFYVRDQPQPAAASSCALLHLENAAASKTFHEPAAEVLTSRLELLLCLLIALPRSFAFPTS